jgi:hypothetical protein
LKESLVPDCQGRGEVKEESSRSQARYQTTWRLMSIAEVLLDEARIAIAKFEEHRSCECGV